MVRVPGGAFGNAFAIFSFASGRFHRPTVVAKRCPGDIPHEARYQRCPPAAHSYRNLIRAKPATDISITRGAMPRAPTMAHGRAGPPRRTAKAELQFVPTFGCPKWPSWTAGIQNQLRSNLVLRNVGVQVTKVITVFSEFTGT